MPCLQVCQTCRNQGRAVGDPLILEDGRGTWTCLPCYRTVQVDDPAPYGCKLKDAQDAAVDEELKKIAYDKKKTCSD